jgi:murein DD-endopeptidase MepM/ murein hydrolase activator NlpD
MRRNFDMSSPVDPIGGNGRSAEDHRGAARRQCAGALTDRASFATETGRGKIVTTRGWLGFVLLILVVGLGGLAWVRAEGSAPLIHGPPSLVVGAPGRDVDLELTDEGAGLREIRVTLQHAGGESVLVDEQLAGNLATGGGPEGTAQHIQLRIDPEALGLRDGDAFLQVVATDWSWRGGFGGNTSELAIPLAIDGKKPRIQIATGLTYIHRGGSGAVSYTVSEPTARDGVAVGDAFFRGFPDPDSATHRVALYAVPTDSPPNPAVRVVAEDEAGNVATAGWHVVVRERALPDANVTLPQNFLDSIVHGLAGANGIDTSDLGAAFREINTVMRRTNEEQVREITAPSAPKQLWNGPFDQLVNSKVTSRFAEHRSYFIDGEKNSEAVHFGYDLASTAAAPITASNAGRVIYADDLGIYGNCVVIDHGLGLATLYGHLSRIDVGVGDEVAKGGALGLSGATGLAGGDHLHFAILVGGTYVDPLEWWDPAWMRTHIEARLEPPGR